MITWPGVIKYEGDDELSYVGSESEWAGAARPGAFTKGDVLIDSRGRVFDLTVNASNTVALVETRNTLPVEEMTRLVQAHAALMGELCAPKMVLGSVAEGIAFVGELDEP